MERAIQFATSFPSNFSPPCLLSPFQRNLYDPCLWESHEDTFFGEALASVQMSTSFQPDASLALYFDSGVFNNFNDRSNDFVSARLPVYYICFCLSYLSQPYTKPDWKFLWTSPVECKANSKAISAHYRRSRFSQIYVNLVNLDVRFKEILDPAWRAEIPALQEISCISYVRFIF